MLFRMIQGFGLQKPDEIQVVADNVRAIKIDNPLPCSSIDMPG